QLCGRAGRPDLSGSGRGGPGPQGGAGGQAVRVHPHGAHADQPVGNDFGAHAMRGKTALLAAVLAGLLLPASALAQTVNEGLAEVVGTLDLDALAEAAEDVPWLEGGVEQVITRLASGQAALTANEVLRWLM